MHLFKYLTVKLFLCVLAVLPLVTGTAPAEETEGYCNTTIRVGLRDDAPPFSFRPDLLLANPEKDQTAQVCGSPSSRFPDHAGFTVGLCDALLDRLNDSCQSRGGAGIEVEYVSVQASERLDALLGQSSKEIDLLCGATTATVWLSGRLPHTFHTFLTPSRAMLPPRFGTGDTPECRIGVVQGTTSSSKRTDETLLPGWGRFVSSNDFCGAGSEPPVVGHGYADYPSALADLLGSGTPQADVLIGDHHILRWYRENLDQLKMNPDNAWAVPRVEQRSFTLEPYAIFGGHDDQKLVAQLNVLLAEQQRDGSFEQRLSSCFGRRLDESLLRLLDIHKRTPFGTPEQ